MHPVAHGGVQLMSDERRWRFQAGQRPRFQRPHLGLNFRTSSEDGQSDTPYWRCTYFGLRITRFGKSFPR